MASSEITELFTDFINKWRATDSQRMIFGVQMPQTQRAIEDLHVSLQKALDVHPEFLIVQKDQLMEVIVDEKKVTDSGPSLTSIPANLPSLPKVFEELNINSITLSAGIEKKELIDFFTGLSLKVDEVEDQGGLKGYLQKNNVTHIRIDQMKFQLLKDEDQVVSSKEAIGGAMQDISAEEIKEAVKLKKLQDTIWKDYLEDKLSDQDFKNNQEEFVSKALSDPKRFEKVLKRVISKQKEAEKFLAHLEKKLFEIGFPEDAVEALKKKLKKPKKVLVPEDELARLRKIEKSYLKTVDKRSDDTLDTINKIKKKLSNETERSEAILHQMSQGGIVLDEKGKIISINHTAQNVLGVSLEEIRGKNVKDVLNKHHSLTMVSDWQKETDAHTPKEVQVQSLNEETLSIIRESAVVIENEDGRSIGVLSALQNVTQQEELNRRKNDILDVLGHDLRAPLGAIKQNFDVLIQSSNLNIDENSPQQKFLDNCKNNITRMSNMIEKILDTRQLETGKIMLKYDSIKTNSLLEDAAASLKEWADNKKIKIEVKANELPDIEGDPERLYQILTNLISNALKFTPEEGSIAVGGKINKSKEGDLLEVSVTDSGMGISKENLTKIFDKYQQVGRNTPKGVRGLGLGLSICKTIAELHGGTIWADSEPEKGSTFTFQIPIKQRVASP